MQDFIARRTIRTVSTYTARFTAAHVETIIEDNQPIPESTVSVVRGIKPSQFKALRDGSLAELRALFGSQSDAGGRLGISLPITLQLLEALSKPSGYSE
jgi:hypothetical protein